MRKGIQKWKNFHSSITTALYWMESRECCCNDMMKNEHNPLDETSMTRILLGLDNNSPVDILVELITNSIHNSPTVISSRRRPMISSIPKDPTILLAQISILRSNSMMVALLLIKTPVTRPKDRRLLIATARRQLLFIRITVLSLLLRELIRMNTTTMQTMINSNIHHRPNNNMINLVLLSKTMALRLLSSSHTIKSLPIKQDPCQHNNKVATIPGTLNLRSTVNLCRGEIVEVVEVPCRRRDEVVAEEDVAEVVAASTIEIVAERDHIKHFRGVFFFRFRGFYVLLPFRMHHNSSFQCVYWFGYSKRHWSDGSFQANVFVFTEAMNES